MSGNTKEPLKPCIHAVSVGYKASIQTDFSTALSPCVKKGNEAISQSITKYLNESRKKIVFEIEKESQNEYEIPSNFNIEEYIQEVVTYLSLIKGFDSIQSIEDSNNLSNDSLNVNSPLTTQSKTMDEPLIKDKNSKSEASPISSSKTSSELLSFVQWKDIVNFQTIYVANSRQEYAQALLGAGIVLLHHGRLKVDQILGDRSLNEENIRLAYRSFIYATGVFEACLRYLGYHPQTVGAEVTDLNQKTSITKKESDSIPTEEEMEQWRKEQANEKVEIPGEPHIPLGSGVKGTDIVGDLASGHLAQLLAWVALSQAQELTIYRATSNEQHDNRLIARLCRDTSNRFQECNEYASKNMPNGQLTQKLVSFTKFKSMYYSAISVYYQGMMQFEKDDAEGCVKAIANLGIALKEIEDCIPLQIQYATTLMKSERGTRESVLTKSCERSREIVERDLDIAREKNRSIYYEPIPEPEKEIEPIALAKPIAFPEVPLNAVWSVNPFDPNISPKRSDSSSLCASCAIL